MPRQPPPVKHAATARELAAHVRDLRREGFTEKRAIEIALEERSPWQGRPNYVENPSWVTKALTRHYEFIEDQVKAQWLPRLESVQTAARGKAIAGKLREYGCGAYGCVYRTLDPKVVLKVTTDSTEAEFAARLAPSLKAPITVAYHAVAALPEHHQRRQVFLLWREEAQEVGGLDETPGTSLDAVNMQHEKAQAAYDILMQQGDATGALKEWEHAVEAYMRPRKDLAFVAAGLLKVYREQRIFFGDIHAGNLGKCPRSASGNTTPEWVVTDPGHVAVIGCDA